MIGGKVFPRYQKRKFTTNLRRDVNKLKKQMGQVELKFFDKVVDQIPINSSGDVLAQIFTIAEGDNQSQRHGRRIQIKSVSWRGIVLIPSTGIVGDASDTVRLMLVKDNSANGALPSVLDVLASANWESYTNLENKSRFRILMDKHIAISSGGVEVNTSITRTLPYEKFFKVYKKMDVTIEYNDTASTGVISTINTNNIILLVISRQSNAELQSCTRVRYTDM